MQLCIIASSFLLFVLSSDSAVGFSSSSLSFFSPSPSPSRRQQQQHTNRQYQQFTTTTTTKSKNDRNLIRSASSSVCVVVLHMSDTGGEKDEYDDFYADYDPSLYESINSEPDYYNGGGGGGGGYGRQGGGGRRQGGRERSFDYSRDTSRDSSNVDEGAVLEMLRRRGDAKRSRDFDTADAIREELITEYQVGVDDRDMSWRTGVSSSGSGRGGRGGGRSGRGGGRGGRSGGGGGRGRRQQQDFGPHGHDYDLSAEAGPNSSGFSDQDIHGMLAERLQAKLVRDFGTADALQADLVARGVFVHDGTKEWRADGVPYGSFAERNNRIGNQGRSTHNSNNMSRNAPYVKSSFSVPIEGDNSINDELIDGLVQERFKFKTIRDFDKADAIREGLRTKYNVLIDDRLRMWSAGGDFGEEHNSRRELSKQFTNRGYVKSSSSLEVAPEDHQHIQDQIDERLIAKNDRDFDTADTIRQDLLEQFDVSINDKMKLWSVGGAFEETGRTQARGVYTRRGGGNLSSEDLGSIENLLMERYKYKKDRNFDAADDIRTELQDTYNVRIDDRSSEWKIDTDEYAQIGPSNLSADDTKFVEAKVSERFYCKRDRDYDSADEIRDELRAKFGVILDDRTKEWKLDPAEITFVAGTTEKENTEEVAEHFMDDDAIANADEGKEEDTLDDSEADIDNDDDASYEDPVESSGTIAEENLGEENAVETMTTEEELIRLTVPVLKEKLRDAGLPVSGKKSELIARLLS